MLKKEKQPHKTGSVKCAATFVVHSKKMLHVYNMDYELVICFLINATEARSQLALSFLSSLFLLQMYEFEYTIANSNDWQSTNRLNRKAQTFYRLCCFVSCVVFLRLRG